MIAVLALFLNSALADIPTHGWDLAQNKEIAIPSGEQATVYVFLSPDCPCSKSHETKLRALAEKFSSKGIAFIGIDSHPGLRTGETAAHFEAAKLPFPVIRDDRLVLANEFGAQKTPHVFVVKKGTVVYSGGVDSSQSAAADAEPYLDTALTQLISGSDPHPAQTRALGCVISRSLSS